MGFKLLVNQLNYGQMSCIETKETIEFFQNLAFIHLSHQEKLFYMKKKFLLQMFLDWILTIVLSIVPVNFFALETTTIIVEQYSKTSFAKTYRR